jgi:glutathione S-transferase
MSDGIDRYPRHPDRAGSGYGWAVRGELPARELVNLTAHKDRMLKRPAVRKALEIEQNVLVKV